MEFNSPVVTFITVVYNGVSELEATMLSILNQADKRFEYIIIDGGSTDGTLDLIHKYESKITKWISEKDNGLYDAMNKGMKMARGKYIWFMNAGDQVRTPQTLSEILSSITEWPDVIYGETDILDKNGQLVGERRLKAPGKLTWKSLQWGMVVCHQSFLVKREHCLSYDLKYKLASDIDWMIRMLKSNTHIHNTGIILSCFKSGGYSQKNIRNGLKERFRIMVHYYGFTPTVLRHGVLATKFLFYFLQHGRI